MRNPVVAIAALMFLPSLARAQECKEAGISCQFALVRTASVSEVSALKVFEVFAKEENFNCSPVPSVPSIVLSCKRLDGISVDARRGTGKLVFVSRAFFGLKGTDTLRTFNARLAGALRAELKDAVEASPATGSVPTIDRFSGVYLSESRGEYGTSSPGEVRIEVTRDGFTFLLKYFRADKPLFTTQAEECDPRKYPIQGNDWSNANVSGLCTPQGAMQLLYTEKGLTVPFRGSTFRSRYYSHVQMSFYAFRKVK